MSGDNAFFEELQMDFLNESAFMLEQYEEYMMRLENSENPVKDLTDIFRVAHSVKGGAAAVGLADLCKFAHVMEDLLDLLRSRPELVNSTVISLLLQSGDELKNRIGSLQQGQNNPWDPSALKTELVALTEQLSGKASKHSQEPAPSADEPKIDVPDDFFTQTPTAEAAAPAAEDDVTNHDLLAELLAQLSPEDQAEYYAKEEAEKQSAQPAPVATAEPVVAAAPTPAPVAEKPAPV
jgi:two-component system chemotaxis sensor kinase CheA